MEEKKPQSNSTQSNTSKSAPTNVSKPTQPKNAEAAKPSVSKPTQPKATESKAANAPTSQKQPSEASQAASKKKWELGALAKSLTEVFVPAQQTSKPPHAAPTSESASKEEHSQLEQEQTPQQSVSASTTPSARKGFVIQPWQLIVAAVLIVSLIGGGVGVGIVLGKRNANKSNSPFDDSAVDHNWTPPTGSAANEDGIVLPGYAYLIFPAGEKTVEILLPNPTGNPCHFQYEMLLVETGEVLYRSKLIQPGKAVPAIELARPLSAGTYTLRITINTYSLADGVTPMNGGEQDVKLYVK